MQAELDPERFVILGINETGYDSGNGDFCEGRDIPWLQDTGSVDLWGDWSVTYRDVYVLDAANELVDVYNLTDNDLDEVDAYEELLALIEGAE